MWELRLSLQLRVAGSGLSTPWCQLSLYGDWGQPETAWHGGSEYHGGSPLSLTPALLMLGYLYVYMCVYLYV